DSQETIFTSGQQQTPLLATGQLDVGTASVNAASFNAVQQGIRIKYVVDDGHLEKGTWSYGLLLRADLADGGAIKGIADMKGKDILTSTDFKTGGTGYSLQRMLASVKLTLEDVNSVTIPLPQFVDALSNKKGDFAAVFEPFATLLTDRKVAVRWQSSSDWYDGEQVGALVYSQKFIEERN